MIIAVLVYFIGILIARWQLQYWFKDVLVDDEAHDMISVLSLLSWFVYPAYVWDYMVERLNNK